uniref:Paraneoplastic antigen Ma-like C-terminal domain-containing protein n=1 Tax=Leptobrachium leishanense TaxID=445787 RepID=A0A8C5PWD4_9ANUR
MDPDTVAEWCGEHSSQSECCIVMDIPADTWAEDQIRQAVATLAPDHRGLILDIEKNPDTSHMYVLLEWRKGVPPCFQGTSVKLAEEVEVQLIKPSTPRGESASVSVPSPLAMIGPEFIVAIGDLLAKCQKTSPPHTNFGYRRLRNFTGNVPTPAGEETFEEWVEQAMQALDEWDVPEAQKKQRITESLKGPASEAVRNLKLSRKDCTALDYLNVLEEVFGRTEKAAELVYQYEHTYQRRGERMTEYMRRLDKILHQILLKKGAEPAEVDKIRIKQILRGSQPLDPVMMQLRSRAGNQELKYLELIRVVREEEALLEEKSFRRGERAYAQPVRHNDGLQPESDSLDTYGSDEDEQEHLVGFKSTEKAAKESNLPEWGELSKTVKKVQEAQVELQQAHAELCRVLMKVTEMQAELQKFLTGMQTTGVAVASGPNPLTKSQQATTSPLSKKRCFGCGEMSHFRAQCKGRKPEKDRVKGLLEALEGLLSTSPAGNARGHQ